MKVALCTLSFADFTVSLARALSAYCEVTAFLPKGISISGDCFKSIQTFPYHARLSSWNKFRACYEMVRQIRAFRPDIVHLQGSTPYLIPFLPLLYGFTVVKTLHDPVPHSGEEQWSKRLTQRIVTRLARQVIVLAQAMHGVTLSAYPWLAGKLSVVPHGTYECYCAGNENRPGWLPSGKKYILFFGRVSKYKGVEDLLKAFQLLQNRDDLNLVIAGQQLYQLSIPAEITNRVFIADEFISNDVLRHLFRHCELVALPYRDATQSGVLMIAYAFARPIIATTVGGFPEMVRDKQTGLLVPPCAPEQLAVAIETCLLNPLQSQEMGRRGQIWAQDQFSWQSIAKRTFEIYNSLAAPPEAMNSTRPIHESAPSN